MTRNELEVLAERTQRGLAAPLLQRRHEGPGQFTGLVTAYRDPHGYLHLSRSGCGEIIVSGAWDVQRSHRCALIAPSAIIAP